MGPWENAPFNPLLRTESRNEKWWSKGHGSIVDTEDGRLFMIFHAYENGFQTLGRQTLLRELVQKRRWMVTFERRSHFFTCTGTFEIIWYRRFCMADVPGT